MDNFKFECAICYEELRGGYKLECGHAFHECCIELCRKDTCPLCRRPFKLIADAYILELCFIGKVNKYALFRAFPRLEIKTYRVVNKSETKIDLYFEILEERDKWFDLFSQSGSEGEENEIKSCKKTDIKIDVRKVK